MKEILIVSGKGGSGKTSLAACFAQLAGNCVLADCDVDAADLALLLHPETTQSQEFFAGVLPEIDPTRCNHCGACVANCRFHAISRSRGVLEVISGSCEGCGVCAGSCPAGCIELKTRLCGHKMRSQTRYGIMFHAELLPGAENSGKLVAELRRAAKAEAEASARQWLIDDGPPGIGCPVISASTGVDYAVIVTEPTVSGIHDMRRLAALLEQFEIPFALVVNKADLNVSATAELKRFCDEQKIPLLGEIPFDPAFPEMLCEGKTVLERPDSHAAQMIKKIWNNLKSTLPTGETQKC